MLKLKFEILWKLFYDAAASGCSYRSKTVIRENKDIHPITISAAKCFVYSAENNRLVKTTYAGWDSFSPLGWSLIVCAFLICARSSSKGALETLKNYWNVAKKIKRFFTWGRRKSCFTCKRWTRIRWKPKGRSKTAACIKSSLPFCGSFFRCVITTSDRNTRRHLLLILMKQQRWFAVVDGWKMLIFCQNVWWFC